jgi:hypothetical protein
LNGVRIDRGGNERLSYETTSEIDMFICAFLMAALLAFPSSVFAQDRVSALVRACENQLFSHQYLLAELSAIRVSPSALCACAAPIVASSGLNRSDVNNFVRSGQLTSAAIGVLLKINRSCVAH